MSVFSAWQLVFWREKNERLVDTILFVFLGDEIPKEDTIKLLEELADKEDEDGFIPYKPFLDRLCGKA